MNAESKPRTAPSIYGHMITLGVGHSIAIYERNRENYVAEFRDGGARLEYAGSWFRFHAGGLRYCHNRRAALRSSMPLTPEILEKIERLHAESDAREERVLAVPRTVFAAARRYCINVISRLRGHAAKLSRTFG
jgi:hypothetical protein